jgi:hypothetical protein
LKELLNAPCQRTSATKRVREFMMKSDDHPALNGQGGKSRRLGFDPVGIGLRIALRSPMRHFAAGAGGGALVAALASAAFKLRVRRPFNVA